jgi:hypothetical protein
MIGLSNSDVHRLRQFNLTADEIIKSSYVKESLEKRLGINFKWTRNNETNDLDFSYQKFNHEEDKIRSLILTIRIFIQDNEPLSIRRMRDFYQELPIDQKYKVVFDSIRDQFNEFLDEPATTFLEDRPSRRQIFETIIYGMYAHRNRNKMGTIETWKSDPIDWDMVFYQFQVILHDFAIIVERMKRLNEKVLKDHGLT